MLISGWDAFIMHGAAAANPRVVVDGTCVRVGTLRCHSQAITLKLREDVPLAAIEEAIAGHNEWVALVPNTKEATMQELTPAAISGSLKVPTTNLVAWPRSTLRVTYFCSESILIFFFF